MKCWIFVVIFLPAPYSTNTITGFYPRGNPFDISILPRRITKNNLLRHPPSPLIKKLILLKNKQTPPTVEFAYFYRFHLIFSAKSPFLKGYTPSVETFFPTPIFYQKIGFVKHLATIVNSLIDDLQTPYKNVVPRCRRFLFVLYKTSSL